jgi:cold shock CspA family protein
MALPEFYGKVERWSPSRGFGFVRLHDGRNVFVRLAVAAAAGLQELVAGQDIGIDIAASRSGWSAVRIHPIAPRNWQE